MAAFGLFKDMYDVGLKPLMLRTLLRNCVPDEKQPLLRSFELSKVVSEIQTYSLLSESFAETTDQKQIHLWKSAIDDWVNRLLMLVSSDVPDKCWAGICLLGVTCQECSDDRFLSSYSTWFHKFLSHIQPPADSQFVKVASCTSISDLLTRLGRFPNVRKDGTLYAGKLLQPILKLLNEDNSEAVCEGTVNLLYTAITIFPSSVHHYYDEAEGAIASKIISGKCSPKLLKKLGQCLALLPKSKGDEDSWCLMMQKILILLNNHLNDAFQGVEEETNSSKAMRLSFPPGKAPPPLLGGHKLLTEGLEEATKRSERLPTSSVCTLMISCCTLLQSSYPVQVSAPIGSLLALVERVLMVDGSIPQSMSPIMTAMHQELICSELPLLHAHSLELLIAIIKAMRSQLLPHAACIVRLVTKYWSRCQLPELRVKLYSVTKVLLITMGVGMAIYLAQDVIEHACTDLSSTGGENIATANACNKSSTEAIIQPCNRKRKHGAKMGSPDEQQDRTGSEVEALKKSQMIPVSLKIAALEALETLLMVGGSSRAESWRSRVDNLLIMVATNSCKGGWANEENIFLPHETISVWVDFQLAALRALLASLLAPTRVRPPYLTQGLELFRRGKQEAGTKLAGFCAYALLALEAVIHPRALPVDDFMPIRGNSDVASGRFPENLYYNVQSSGRIQRTRPCAPEDDGDDLYHLWMGNGNEIEAPISDPINIMNNTVKPVEAVRLNFAEKPVAIESSGMEVTSKTVPESAAVSADVPIRSNEDQVMVESQDFQESNVQFQETISSKGAASPAVNKNPEGTEMLSRRAAMDSDVLASTDHDTLSRDDVLEGKVEGPDVVAREDVMGDKADGFDHIGGNVSSTITNSERRKVSDGSDSDTSMVSLPPILYIDPGTDTDSD